MKPDTCPTGKMYQKMRDRKPIGMWFSNSPEGLALFVVFYTKACRWNRCSACSLPSLSSREDVDFRSLMAQIDFVYRDPEIEKRFENIRRVVVSNNGSVLDAKTFSSTALIYFVAKTNMLIPNLSVLTIETRPEYVNMTDLEFLSRAISEGETPTNLEIAVGLEAYDNHIRNKAFRKGLSLRTLEQLAEKLSPYNFRLKCYLMQKPVVGMTDEEAIEDIRLAIDYLDRLATRFKIGVNMHLNPTYVSVGSVLAEAFRVGTYQPPFLLDVVRAINHARSKNISVCVGLNDEGLAIPGGSFLRDSDSEIIKRLETFNATQNFDVLY